MTTTRTTNGRSVFGQLDKTDENGQFSRWTPDMDAQVMAMHEAGMTNSEIGGKMCLRESQVGSRIRELRAWMLAAQTCVAKEKSASEIARGPAMRMLGAPNAGLRVRPLADGPA